MADRPAVLSHRVEEEGTRRVYLAMTGLDPIKASSKTQLPAWQPDTLTLRYWHDGAQWFRRDFAILSGTCSGGQTRIAIFLGEHDEQWPWVTVLIDNYQPKG